MKKRILQTTLALSIASLIGGARAANFTVTTTASDGPGSFSQAIRDADASAGAATINFNIAGAGPHYITPPAAGFPLVTKDNLTIDGYSQPGAAVNTAPITASNNAAIKIVLDARSPNANFRDMAYIWYGTFVTSDPVINNSSMAGSPAGTNPERGGYGEDSLSPYTPGEVAILGIYRATNVWVKGLAFLSDGSGADYAVAVAIDYGLDTAVKDRLAYTEGSCRGFHISGCWIGTDPGTGAESPSGAAIAAFRHRDKGTGGTRPELPNQEDMVIGVKKGSSNPRAEFNVLNALGATIASEGFRFTVAGNQFITLADTDIGRYDDTQVPSVIFGTDGDGVNDADEGNLFPSSTISLYNTGNKVYKVAGNIFGLARDGSRTSASKFLVDQFRLDQRTRVIFGSDINGRNDGLEANQMYDTLGLAVNAGAPDNTAWILMRGNKHVHGGTTMPMDETAGDRTYTNFIDTAVSAITPVITSATTASLIGTCGTPKPAVTQIVVDVYASDPEGDTAGIPQGLTYLGSFTDNSAADSNPAVGAFTFNIASLGVSANSKITIAANYLRPDSGATISSVSHAGSSTTLAITGGVPPFDIQRSSSASGPYTTLTSAAATPATFTDAAATSYYKVGYLAGGGQTTPFATSATVAP